MWSAPSRSRCNSPGHSGGGAGEARALPPRSRDGGKELPGSRPKALGLRTAPPASLGCWPLCVSRRVTPLSQEPSCSGPPSPPRAQGGPPAAPVGPGPSDRAAHSPGAAPLRRLCFWETDFKP